VGGKRISRALEDPSDQDEPSEIRRRFARNLRQAREAAGLTQNALAGVAACAPRLLANIENKAANVKLDTITRLARALSVKEVDLLLPEIDNIPIKQGRRPPIEPLSKAEPTEFRRRFAQNLRERRLALGMYQTTLSEAAGMQPSVEGEIEVNAKNVTLDTVTRLAQPLGVREIDLLGPKNG
jgi:transcriptional regulator with XRE-family HTH domain